MNEVNIKMLYDIIPFIAAVICDVIIIYLLNKYIIQNVSTSSCIKRLLSHVVIRSLKFISIVNFIILGLLLVLLSVSFKYSVKYLFNSSYSKFTKSKYGAIILAFILFYPILKNIVHYINDKYCGNDDISLDSNLVLFKSLAVCYVMAIIIISLYFKSLISSNRILQTLEFLLAFVISLVIFGLLYFIGWVFFIMSYYNNKEIIPVSKSSKYRYSAHNNLINNINEQISHKIKHQNFFY